MGPTEFEYGDLEALHPEETFEQIKQRREDNFTVFKNLCNAKKITGETVATEDGLRLEMYVEPTIEEDLTNGSINITSGQTLTVDSGGDIVFYPFVLNKKRFTVFNVKYGGTINLSGNWSGQDIQGKLETYNITFRVGGDLKKIQVNGTVRDGFWDNMQVGDDVFCNHAHETLGEIRTIASWDEETGIITLNEDLTYGSTDLNNQYTKGGFIFNEDVSLADYQEHGEFWIYDYHRCYFVYSIPPSVGSPPPVTINLTDFEIYGFAGQVIVSLANGSINYFGTSCKHERNEIAVNFFSRGTANYQKYNFQGVDNLYFVDCGTMAGGSITGITAGDILGSGVYMHPNILVRGGSATDPEDLTVGVLRLHYNIGTAFRQYSFGGDNPVILGDPEYRSDFGLIDCIGNIEADIRTSNLIPTRITNIPNSTATCNFHYQTTINGGKILGPCLINPNESNSQGLFETNVIFNDMEINQGDISFDLGGNTTFNNCEIHVKPTSVNSTQVFNVIVGEPDIRFINCEFVPDAAITRYTPGGAEAGGATLGKAILFTGNNADESTVRLCYFENCSIKDNDYYCGWLIREGSAGFPTYDKRNRKFQIVDSDLRVSRFDDYTHLRANFTNQVEVENSRINSARMVQSTSFRPFKYFPREVSVTKNISAGVIEFDFENVINIEGGGTLHTLSPILYNGATKVDCSMWYTGTIRLNAVGASFTIANTGNIDQSITVNDGDYIELTASRDIIGTLSSDQSLVLATSDGTLEQINNTLAALVGIDHRFIEVTDITSDEVATVDADGDIVGVNTFGILDNRTGSFDIKFNTPVPNGQTVTLNYKYYTAINFKGVWKG